MNRIRTPSSWSSGVSRSIRSRNMRIRPSTSAGGRDQFSVENENTVSSSTPKLDRVAQSLLDHVGAGLVTVDRLQPAPAAPSDRCRP